MPMMYQSKPAKSSKAQPRYQADSSAQPVHDLPAMTGFADFAYQRRAAPQQRATPGAGMAGANQPFSMQNTVGVVQNPFPIQYPRRVPTASANPATVLPDAGATHASDAPVAQLKVDKYRAGAWYSSFDPYTTFGTKAEATVYDRKLRDQGRESLRARVPTIYTYTHTKPTNKLSFALQGPHTVAHRLILQALIDATTAPDVFTIFDAQVLDPATAEEVVFTDEVPESGSFSSTLTGRLDRFVEDYKDIYDRALLEFDEKSPDLIALKHMTNQLLNMDPYAVYSWKTTTKASQKSLAGKGESKSDPTWDDLYDKPPSSSFREKDNLQGFVDSRKQLFDDTF